MIDEYNYNDEPSGRVDTLAMALEKCERLEKENKKMKQKIYIVQENLYCIHNHCSDYETQRMIKNMIDILKQAEVKEK